jgi:hypothetical protein
VTADWMFGGLLGVVGLDVLWFLVRLALPVEMERHASAKALRAHRRPHCFAELYAVEAEVSRYDIQPGATLPTIGTALVRVLGVVSQLITVQQKPEVGKVPPRAPLVKR